jgi:hypothetical protein
VSLVGRFRGCDGALLLPGAGEAATTNVKTAHRKKTSMALLPRKELTEIAT